MGVLVLILAWCALSWPTGLLVGRFLAYSSRGDVEFEQAMRREMAAERLRRTAS